MNNIKNIYIGKAINRFLLILISIGILGNLFVNNTYLRGWTIGEWLISYSGLSDEVYQELSFLRYQNIQILILNYYFLDLYNCLCLFLINNLNFCRNKFDKSFIISIYFVRTNYW